MNLRRFYGTSLNMTYYQFHANILKYRLKHIIYNQNVILQTFLYFYLPKYPAKC